MTAPLAPLPVRRPDPWFRPSRTRHVVIADDLRALIENGRIERGGKLPDVPSLRAEYKCTAKTVLRALRTLELEGLIYRLLGQGYFVQPYVPVAGVIVTSADDPSTWRMLTSTPLRVRSRTNAAGGTSDTRSGVPTGRSEDV
jgi:DNA-binding transcriptional MocR family regulator